MAVTILDLAVHRLKQAGRYDEGMSLNGALFESVGLPIMGGCQVCGASIAAYNACPSKTGYLMCDGGCIDDQGWDDVQKCDAALRSPDTVPIRDRRPEPGRAGRSTV